MRRKEVLITGNYYHIFNKSIAGYRIFSEEGDCLRMKQMMKYYQYEGRELSFSHFVRFSEVEGEGFWNSLPAYHAGRKRLVEIAAYCIMPTHLHFILKQIKQNGIEKFIGNVLNSYTRYFNLRRKRSGPLWQSRFQSVSVESDEQLLHLTRYIHLNPVTAYLVERPEEWHASSYEEYLRDPFVEEEAISSPPFDRLDNIAGYKQFVHEGIQYQRDRKN